MNEVIKKVNKMSNNIKDLVSQEVFFKINDTAIPQVIDIIERSYTNMLEAIPFHKNSELAPYKFKDLFMNRLNSFTFIEVSNGEVDFNVPDPQTFDFSGDLRILQVIVEGLAPSDYVEINEDDRRKIKLARSPISFIIKGKYVYLYTLTAKINTLLKDNNIELLRFPFSKAGPQDIFAEANEFVDDNISRWLSTASSDALRRFEMQYK